MDVVSAVEMSVEGHREGMMDEMDTMEEPTRMDRPCLEERMVVEVSHG